LEPGRFRIVLLAVLGAALLAGGYVTALSVAPQGAAAVAATTDEGPTTAATEPEPEPAPDPAPAPPPPPPKPKPAPTTKPKPAPKPAAKATPKATPLPARTEPTPAATPDVAPESSNAPQPTVRRAKPKKAVNRKPKVARPVVTTTTGQVKAAVVPVSRVPVAATITTSDGDAARRAVVISGLAIAALLFFLVTAASATALRFTAPGRAVLDRQTDLVLSGVAMLLLTAVVFLVTK
jgi:hypothetical protein